MWGLQILHYKETVLVISSQWRRVFKILTFSAYQEIVKLSVSKLEGVGKIEYWDDLWPGYQLPRTGAYMRSRLDLAG